VTDVDTKRNAENTLITIQWDSVTLREIPEKYIIVAIEEELSCQTMVLYDTEV